MMRITIALLSPLIALTVYRADAARSLSARRVRGAPSARPADKYDRSITTFSPEGRLLQLEYALVAAEERARGLTLCVECDGTVVFAFPSGDDDDWSSCQPSLPPAASSESVPDSQHAGESDERIIKYESGIDPFTADQSPKPASVFAPNTEHVPAHNTKVHRLSPTHLLLTSGLAGDSRTLASAFRRLAASFTHIDYGEVVTAMELVKEMGKLRHGIGLQRGARVLGVIGMLIGLDDADDESDQEVEVRMYRSLPGGTIDRCNIHCAGGGGNASGNAARKDAMDKLLSVISPDNEEGSNDRSSSEEVSFSGKEEKLQLVIKEVGGMVLKYHPNSQAHEEPSDEVPHGEKTSRQAVDIWVVRAAPSNPTNRDGHNRAFLSPHRRLGKTLMETRYARRVAVDQLSKAAQCLVQKKVKT